MSFETEKFCLSDVEWICSPSREISLNPALPVRTGVRAVTAVCKGCAHVWRARQYGEGKLQSVLGGAIITCLGCGAQEHVSGGKFEQS